jgi:hypothetical protein
MEKKLKVVTVLLAAIVVALIVLPKALSSSTLSPAAGFVYCEASPDAKGPFIANNPANAPAGTLPIPPARNADTKWRYSVNTRVKVFAGASGVTNKPPATGKLALTVTASAFHQYALGHTTSYAYAWSMASDTPGTQYRVFRPSILLRIYNNAIGATASYEFFIDLNGNGTPDLGETYYTFTLGPGTGTTISYSVPAGVETGTVGATGRVDAYLTVTVDTPNGGCAWALAGYSSSTYLDP